MQMIQNATARADEYQAEPIMQKFMLDMGLGEHRPLADVETEHRSVA